MVLSPSTESHKERGFKGRSLTNGGDLFERVHNACVVVLRIVVVISTSKPSRIGFEHTYGGPQAVS